MGSIFIGTINEIISLKKGRPRCNTKIPTEQDVFQVVPCRPHQVCSGDAHLMQRKAIKWLVTSLFKYAILVPWYGFSSVYRCLELPMDTQFVLLTLSQPVSYSNAMVDQFNCANLIM